MPSHNEFRFCFTIRDGEKTRAYEAIGFLRPDETSCLGNVMLERVSLENGGAIAAEDGKLIFEHMQELPFDLCDKFLVTAWRRPAEPNTVCCFGWEVGRWFHFTDYLLLGFNEKYLVVRRAT